MYNNEDLYNDYFVKEIARITKKELKQKLENHKKWLNNEEGGVLADFSYINLEL